MNQAQWPVGAQGGLPPPPTLNEDSIFMEAEARAQGQGQPHWQSRFELPVLQDVTGFILRPAL